jgi:general secretion pathway protein D
VTKHHRPCTDDAHGRTAPGLWKRGLARAAAILLTAALAACSTPPAKQSEDDAHRLLAQGNLDEGLKRLGEAADLSPHDKGLRSEYIWTKQRYIQALIATGDSERLGGRTDEARSLYEKVLKLDALNARAREGMAALDLAARHVIKVAEAQERWEKGEREQAQTLIGAVLQENPNNADARRLQRKFDETLAQEALALPTFKSKVKKPITLQFRDAQLKLVFEAISKATSINVLVDKDLRTDTKTTIFVKDAAVEDAIDLILLENGLEKKVLSDNTILVYANNPAKVREYQDLKIRNFHLVNAEAKQLQTMLKTLIKTRDIYVDEKNNSLIMRDTPDAIRLAEKLIAAEDIPEPEVLLEVEILSVSRTRLENLGFKWPDSLALSASGIQATTSTTTTSGGAVVTDTTPAQPLTLKTLKHLSQNDVNVSALSATIDFHKDHSEADTLASPRIRVKNKEKAKILIGDRVPVITNSVTPVSSGSPVVTGSVQYLDVGIKLDVEPNIYLENDVGIKINLEVSNIVSQVSGGQAGTVAYQIGTRTANTVLRMKDGETQVLAGLIQDEMRKSTNEVPGLAGLPFLGRLFRDNSDNKTKTEVVLSITPHLLRTAQRPDAQNTEFWSGSEAVIRSKPLTVQPVGVVKSTPSTQPGAPGAPGAGPGAPVQNFTPPPPVTPSTGPAPVVPAPPPAAAAPVPAAPTPPPLPGASSVQPEPLTPPPAAAPVQPPAAPPPPPPAGTPPPDKDGAAAPVVPTSRIAAKEAAAPEPQAPIASANAAGGPLPAAAAVAVPAPGSTSAGTTAVADTSATSSGSPSSPADAAPPADPVGLSLTGPGRARTGSEFTVSLVGQPKPSQGVTTLQVVLGYDPVVFRAIRALEGPLFKTGGAQTVFTQQIDPSGRVLLETSQSTGDGAKSSATFASVGFRALGPQQGARIEVISANASGAGGSSIPVAMPNALVMNILP